MENDEKLAISVKPLGGRAYGHIPHLRGSRMGPADHQIADGQSDILTVKTRDKWDVVTVTEKLDGSCVAVANIDGRIVALTRAGYEATTSQYEQHHLYAAWVYGQVGRFAAMLQPGQRVCGEWLAQAHGTRYDLTHEPFVAFDVMEGKRRLNRSDFLEAVAKGELISPRLIHEGGPLSVEDAQPFLKESGHGAIDPVEGCVWRVERRGVVDFLAKWVRPAKTDGTYLPEMNGGETVWNWRAA
jgi:hypothetical protein